MQKFLAQKDDSYYATLAEDVAWDRNMGTVDPEELHFDAEVFLEESCVRKRGEFAPLSAHVLRDST